MVGIVARCWTVNTNVQLACRCDLETPSAPIDGGHDDSPVRRARTLSHSVCGLSAGLVARQMTSRFASAYEKAAVSLQSCTLGIASMRRWKPKLSAAPKPLHAARESLARRAPVKGTRVPTSISFIVSSATRAAVHGRPPNAAHGHQKNAARSGLTSGEGPQDAHGEAPSGVVGHRARMCAVGINYCALTADLR